MRQLLTVLVSPLSSGCPVCLAVIFAWAAIYHTSVAGRREENPFRAYQSKFIFGNSAVSGTLFALFALMSQSSLDRQQKLYESGVTLIAGVSILFAVFFILYGLLLVRTLTKDFASPYARKLFTVAVAFSTAFFASSGILLTSVVAPDYHSKHIINFNIVYFSLDIFVMLIVMGLFAKSVNDTILAARSKKLEETGSVLSGKVGKVHPQTATGTGSVVSKHGKNSREALVNVNASVAKGGSQYVAEPDEPTELDWDSPKSGHWTITTDPPVAAGEGGGTVTTTRGHARSPSGSPTPGVRSPTLLHSRIHSHSRAPSAFSMPTRAVEDDTDSAPETSHVRVTDGGSSAESSVPEGVWAAGTLKAATAATAASISSPTGSGSLSPAGSHSPSFGAQPRPSTSRVRMDTIASVKLRVTSPGESVRSRSPSGGTSRSFVRTRLVAANSGANLAAVAGTSAAAAGASSSGGRTPQVSRAMEDWPASPYDQLDHTVLTPAASGATALPVVYPKLRPSVPASASMFGPSSDLEQTLSDLPSDDHRKPFHAGSSSASSSARSARSGLRSSDPGTSAMLGYLPAIADSPHLSSMMPSTGRSSASVRGTAAGMSMRGAATARDSPFRGSSGSASGAAAAVNPGLMSWSIDAPPVAPASAWSLSSPPVSPAPAHSVSWSQQAPSVSAAAASSPSSPAVESSSIRSPVGIGRHVSVAASRYARPIRPTSQGPWLSHPSGDSSSGAASPSPSPIESLSPMQEVARRRALSLASRVKRAAEDGSSDS